MPWIFELAVAGWICVLIWGQVATDKNVANLRLQVGSIHRRIDRLDSSLDQ